MRAKQNLDGHFVQLMNNKGLTQLNLEQFKVNHYIFVTLIWKKNKHLKVLNLGASGSTCASCTINKI
jgi:hypothetical protein